ncbi:hypothetical protein [Chitinophaga sp.]|uniref:hypothetical protein n=1 Tax=Chitinophaga sp. TaxID=1869181 RepID=UPI0031D21A39
MATLKGPLDFTGTLGNLSAYERKDLDKVIIRKKSSHTKEQIYTDPRFKRIRQNSAEFAACTKLTASIRDATAPVRHLGDTQFTGALNALAKKIQAQDMKGKRGERSLYLSRCHGMITGFNFNANCFFDSVLRFPVTYTLNRETASVTLNIPELTPGVQLHLPWQKPYYRLVASLGAVGDVLFQKGAYTDPGTSFFEYANTDWNVADAVAPATSIHLQITEGISPTATLLLSIGIEAGSPDRFAGIRTVANTGTAKILWAF